MTFIPYMDPFGCSSWVPSISHSLPKQWDAVICGPGISTSESLDRSTFQPAFEDEKLGETALLTAALEAAVDSYGLWKHMETTWKFNSYILQVMPFWIAKCEITWG